MKDDSGIASKPNLAGILFFTMSRSVAAICSGSALSMK